MKTAKGKGAATRETLKPVDDNEEFRKTFKKENPTVKAVSAEKAPYEAKAAKRKGEYQKLITAYNKKQESTTDDGDEESEIHDDGEESGQDDAEEEDDEDEDDD
uniref:HMG box domain-containing protein n=1 Tax=Daucus carota subsp. sativus TaxID=79200 RepID=A0A164Z7E8_DAUCS